MYRGGIQPNRVFETTLAVQDAPGWLRIRMLTSVQVNRDRLLRTPLARCSSRLLRSTG